MGKITARKRYRIGPLVLNFTAAGLLGWRLTSWGLKWWRLSWNSRTERTRVDLPGPYTYTTDGE